MKGTFGLYVGAESNLFNDRPNTGFHVLPIVNLKYMATDNLELRMGMKFWKQRESLYGKIDADESTGMTAEKADNKWVEADNQFRPGFAYHFTKSNLLDVYAGIEGIIGWRRNNITLESTEYLDVKSYTNVRNRNIQFGASAFIGLQAFIARLPLALGLEYGVSTMWDGALKTRTSTKNGDNDAIIKYTADAAQLTNVNIASQQGATAWDGLKARKGAWGSQIRLTLSYYFNR